MTRRLTLGALIGGIAVVAFAFQNCSKGFKSFGSAGSFTSSGSSAGPATNCSLGQHAEGTICAPDQKACSLANGTGQQIWNGAAFNACEAATCNVGFVKVEKLCDALFVPSATSLRAKASARGLMFGTALNYDHLTSSIEPLYAQIAQAQFNMITPENELKWESIRPTATTYDFTKADKLANFALRSGAKMRGHTLAWNNQNPTWLTTGSFTPAQKKQLLEDHIANTIGHYKINYPGLVTTWDVVNEAVNGASLRQTIWSDVGTSPSDYISIAFKAAAKADPTAKLAYNDYSNEDLGVQSNAIFDLISRLKAEGIPIHAVGFQMHLSTEFDSPPVADMRTNIRRYAAIGVEVHMTEADVRTNAADGVSALEAQRRTLFYTNMITVCTTEANCKMFTLWGFTEKFSWVPGAFTGFAATLPYNSNYQPTPTFNILNGAL